eukprot:TRINITY_DN42484_c0_g1_i1.p1 TRINITY_DN42484_c0_g1~~TRINITY_DN42484_c0_g1_i1.p1  ORF type:complete len:134 (-),score=31.53 TRINITY_DN42484_c0_g1_i1:183-584(-)
MARLAMARSIFTEASMFPLTTFQNHHPYSYPAHHPYNKPLYRMSLQTMDRSVVNPQASKMILNPRDHAEDNPLTEPAGWRGITDSMYSYLQKHVNPMAARIQNKGRGRWFQAGRAFDRPIKLFNYIQIENEEY